MKLLLIVGALFAISQAQDCGRFSSDAAKSSFPWTVTIHEAQSGEIIGLGSLISGQHIVTAAHNLWPKPYYKSLKVVPNIYVEVDSQKYDLMDARIHREWNFNRNSSYDADIAVLTLFKTLEFSDSIQPVCVSPNGGDIVVQGGVFVGFHHHKEFHEPTEALKNDDCFSSDQEKTNVSRIYCAIWSSGNIAKSNRIDGAQFYVKNNQWFLQGIETDSFVKKQECSIKQHSVFTNVGKFADWVQEIRKRDTDRVFKDVELKCTFVRNVEGLYGCEVENMNIASHSVRIASISGTHSEKYTNRDVEYVWIKNSKAPFLPTFTPIFFPRLRKYLVTKSQVKFVSRDDFIGMPYVETVDLSDNEIEEIPEDTLMDLSELVDLYISNNKIKYLSPKLLSKNSLFQRFRADNNTIEELEAPFFSKNPSLKIVTLDNNRLKKIKVDFRPFRNLKKLDLLDNPCINTNFNDWRRHKTAEIVQKEIDSSCT